MFESCLRLEHRDISNRSLTGSDKFVQVVDRRPALQGGAREENTFSSRPHDTMPRRRNKYHMDTRKLSIHGGFKICAYHDFLKDMTTSDRIHLFYDDEVLQEYANLQIACGDFTTLTANDGQVFFPIDQVPSSRGFDWRREDAVKDFAREHYTFDHWLKLYRRLDEIDTYTPGCHDAHMIRENTKQDLCGTENRSGRRSSARLATIPQASCPRLEGLFKRAKAYWRNHKYRLIEAMIRTKARLQPRRRGNHPMSASREPRAAPRSTMVERTIDPDTAVDRICQYVVEVLYLAIRLERKKFLDGESLLRAVVHRGGKDTIIASDGADNGSPPRLATAAAAFRRAGTRARTNVGGKLLFLIRYDSLYGLFDAIQTFISSSTNMDVSRLPKMRKEHGRRLKTVNDGFKRICTDTSTPVDRRRDQYCCPPDQNLEDTDYSQRFNIIEGNNNDRPPYVVCSRNGQRTTNDNMALQPGEGWTEFESAPYIVPSNKPGIRTVHECVGVSGRPKAFKRLPLQAANERISVPAALLQDIRRTRAYRIFRSKISDQYAIGIRPYAREVKEWRDNHLSTTMPPSDAPATREAVLPSITEAFNMILLSYDSDAPSFLIDLFFEAAPPSDLQSSVDLQSDLGDEYMQHVQHNDDYGAVRQSLQRQSPIGAFDDDLESPIDAFDDDPESPIDAFDDDPGIQFNSNASDDIISNVGNNENGGTVPGYHPLLSLEDPDLNDLFSQVDPSNYAGFLDEYMDNDYMDNMDTYDD